MPCNSCGILNIKYLKNLHNAKGMGPFPFLPKNELMTTIMMTLLYDIVIVVVVAGVVFAIIVLFSLI